MTFAEIAITFGAVTCVGIPLACIVRVLLYLGTYLDAKAHLIREQRLTEIRRGLR